MTGGDLDIYYSGSHYIRCWCSRWEQDNYSISLETFMYKDSAQTIINNTIPGSIGEWKIATRGYKYYDSTWKGKNTLHISANNSCGSNLRNMRNELDFYPEDIRTEPVMGMSEFIVMKIDGKISGNVFSIG